jgi:hypothetical protein
MHEGKLLLIVYEERKGVFEIIETCLSKTCIAEEIVDGIDDSGKFGESLGSFRIFLKSNLKDAYLAAKIHRVEICL